MLSRIYLIRHGKTDGNRNHWYYGSTDLPLTEEGAGEIRAYAAQGIYPEIPEDADIYTTGLIRTDQTLEAIYGERRHSVIRKLQEIDFGKAECMTYDDLKQFENFDKWAWDTTGDERIADAETANEFHARIHEGLEELLEKHRLKEQSHGEDGKDAVSVMVCHGGVISCIMEKLFPEVCGSMWDWLPEPGFGYAVDFRDGEPYMYTRINDIGRLGLGIYRLPMKGTKRIDHVKTQLLVDSQMRKGHGYYELEFLAWPEGKAVTPDGSISQIKDDRPGISLKRIYKAVRDDLIKRHERERYSLTAIADASMLGEAAAMIRSLGAGYLDRLAVCGIEKYYQDYPEDENIEPETLADKRIDGPEEETGRPAGKEPEEIWTQLRELKEAGLIRKAGLAFSGSATLLDDLLKDRREIDYVELPVNYAMGFSRGDLAQKYYTISRRRYKEILVRSPFAGGVLAAADQGQALFSTSGRSAEDNEILRHSMAGYALLKKNDAPKSAVDWALRYVLSFPFVVICVASTGDPTHASENMQAAEAFRPLTEEDRKKLKAAAGLVYK